MENHEKQIFENTGLDETARFHLLDTVRWTKFLAIIGFIFIGFFLIAALFIMVMGKSLFTLSQSGYPAGFAVVIGIIYIIAAGLYFYPVYALYKFSSCMRQGIMNDDRSLINDAFRYQKLMYKFMGVLIIIVLAFYLLAFIAAGISGAIS